MRVTRVEKFKKFRRRKARNIFIYAIILPCTSIFVGYLITALFILPVMTK